MATLSGSAGSTAVEVLCGKRVLIIEDESIILFQLTKIVQKAGMVVAGVTRDAENAMSLVRSEKPDIVFMDVGLQGEKNGLESAIQLQRTFHCCVILCTGQPRELLEPALAAGVCGVIAKPFTYDVVIESLSHIYGQWNARPQLEHTSRRSAQ